MASVVHNNVAELGSSVVHTPSKLSNVVIINEQFTKQDCQLIAEFTAAGCD